MFMLDTNICIYLIKKNPESVLKHFKSLQIGEVSISSVTLAELQYGVEKSRHRQQNQTALEEFVLPIEILNFDDAAAYSYGKLRSHLEKAGTPIGAMDLMIAAHALSTQCTLVTNNKKEFARVTGLKIENWIN